MKRKWLARSAAVVAMMILFTGCGDTGHMRDTGYETTCGPFGAEAEDDTATHLTVDAETREVMSFNGSEQEESEEGKLLYRVYHYLPGDADPENDELVYEYAYDGFGRLINKKEYSNNTVTFEDVYEYGQAGELVKCTRYFKDEIDLWREYDYDGLIYSVRESTYGAEGNIGSFIEYVTDDFGNILSEYHYDQNERITSMASYRYDAAGNLTDERSTEETYHGIYANKIEYAYDASGNLLKETSYTNGRFYHYNAYVYDSKGNLTRKENHFISSLDGSDTLNDYYEYTYDEDGYLLTAVMYDRDGNVFFDEVNEEVIKGYRYEYIPAKSH